MKTITALRRRLSALAVAFMICVGLGAIAAPSATAATYLGGVNLKAACGALNPGYPSTAYVYTVAPHDAGTWRCSLKGFTGGWYTVGFDMNRVCRWHYGSGAYAVALNWSDKYSWRCYR